MPWYIDVLCAGNVFMPSVPYNSIALHLQAAGLDGITNAWEDVKDFKWHRAQKSPNWHVIPEAEREGDPLAMKAPK